ncbi:integrase [Aeromicrobium panaciterrae]|uniref:Integrase n=1 Tax=Aeromicrobium panaciterrae TaxID=363861 RepID=A0ABU1UNR1_9ACTN|nr:hypothetical protein [Aeromicrobium panaciterrae]MDR7086822.1 integrase [Aeromicrobium panaciterrae]
MARAAYRTHAGAYRNSEARGPSKSAAVLALTLKLRDGDLDHRGHKEDQITSASTLDQLATRWFEEARADGRRTEQTISDYEAMYARHIQPSLGQLRLREIRPRTIDRFLRELRELGKPSVFRHSKTVLSLMFPMAVQLEAVNINPMVDSTTMAKEKKEVRAIDSDTLKALRHAVFLYDRRKRPGPVSVLMGDLVDIMLATGCRIGEALAVRWSDIDLESERPTLTINGSVLEGKRSGMGITRSTTKTPAGIRTVLPAALRCRDADQDEGSQ